VPHDLPSGILVFPAIFGKVLVQLAVPQTIGGR